jgi:hypothetical protein
VVESLARAILGATGIPATLPGRMWRLRHLLVPAAAVCAGILLSACGGDSSPETPIVVPTETTQTGTADKTQFIAQADSICAEANASIEQFAASGQGLTEADQIAQLRQGVIDQINQLNPPSDPNLDQFLKAMADEVSAGKKIALAEQRGTDTAEFESELDTAKSNAGTAAASYGFKECGKAISASSTSTTGGTAGTGGTVSPSAPSTGSPSGTSGSTGGGTSGGGSTGGGSTGGGGGSTGGGGSGGSGGIGPG